MPGGIGMGGWRAIMDLVFPTPPAKGSAARRHPYGYIRAWMQKNAGSVPKLGRMNPGIVVCRVMRDANIRFMAKLGQVATPGYYKLIPRPSHLKKWNEDRFDAVWATPKDARAGKFAGYYRKAPLDTLPTMEAYRAYQREVVIPHVGGIVLGATLVGISCGVLGYYSYRERHKYAEGFKRIAGRLRLPGFGVQQAGAPLHMARLHWHWNVPRFLRGLDTAEACGSVERACQTQKDPFGHTWTTCTWRADDRIVAAAASQGAELNLHNANLWTDRSLLRGRCPR
jgi:hypothetical protein